MKNPNCKVKYGLPEGLSGEERENERNVGEWRKMNESWGITRDNPLFGFMRIVAAIEIECTRDNMLIVFGGFYHLWIYSYRL